MEVLPLDHEGLYILLFDASINRHAKHGVSYLRSGKPKRAEAYSIHGSRYSISGSFRYRKSADGTTTLRYSALLEAARQAFGSVRTFDLQEGDEGVVELE